MRSRSQIVSAIKECGLVAVIRAPSTEMVLPICEALLAGGITSLEITFTVPNALEAIQDVSQKLSGKALVGAGTVLEAESCRSAIRHGAEFIVSPVTKLEVLEAAHALGKPLMLGAYTPTEAQLAHEAGADFIKIFPADKLGPGYIRNIRAPLPHLQIVPTGGVDLQTAPEFLKAGCVALGVGSSLLKPEFLSSGNWAALSQLAADFVKVVRDARSQAS
ncbi:MAG TPA: bifunctional 4-hydroxy-2-oxoglutarate aldolase/2-dehydro-3-deoxy-phosphogluconate aldolase [Candidatus Saccharimonadales bacterium]|nr:bifunctional 4-hydroxy-2-oxoglutarate aldolase/2-dehydro-3-deoxy-phosphogluconate aldolase [Candidatus Saccharimonadales bacterium]